MSAAILARLTCRLLGHRRGKFQYQGTVVEGRIQRTYKCPRCGFEWVRKVLAKEPS